MEICIGITLIALVLVVIFQLVEINRKLNAGGSGGDTVSIQELIDKLDKTTTQIKGFIK